MNFLKRIRNGFKNNLSLAIYSIIIAIISWFVISMTVYSSIAQTIRDVPIDIDITGSAAAENGLSLISCSATGVDVRIKGNRAQIGNLSSDNLKAKLVVDSVASSGTKKLSLDIVCSNPDIEFEVISVYPETVTAVFDKYETREFHVTPEIPNVTFADGKTIDEEEFACTPDTIKITGPSAQLNKIAECAAVYNGEIQLDSSYSAVSDEIKLYADDGATIDPSSFTFDSTNFTIYIPVLTVKSVDLSVGISGAPSTFNSDFLKFDLSEDSITLASKTNQEFPTTFEVGKVLLSDLDVGFTRTFTIDTGNFKNMSNLEAVTVTLDSSNLGRKELTINEFNVTNAPDNYDFTPITKSLDITVIGPKDIVEDITPNDIVADINLLNADKIPESETFTWDITISFPSYNNVWAVTQSKAVVSKKAKSTQTSGSVDGEDETSEANNESQSINE